jgi:cell fate regulator YaaT (PSP1 superfamily)
MPNVVGVRFKSVGKVYYFDPAEYDIKNGDNVIVETARGVEFGEVAMGVKEVADSEIVSPLKKVLRFASDEDKAHAEENRKKEKEAFTTCVKKIEQHNLEMKLIDVEFTFDNNKILFYFTSDGRVDFRDLVKDLAAIFKTRIELRQIGVRDEAKMMGGIGICGRCICCKSFIGDFQPVSIRMAKEQGLSLNPTKISGNCGRLMCCLKYEQNAYEDLIRTTPKQGHSVQTPDGNGVVTEVSLLTGQLKIALDKYQNNNLTTFHKDQVRPCKEQRRPDDRPKQQEENAAE